MVNVLIASDTFKGSVSAPDVCHAIQKGLLKSHFASTTPLSVCTCPISDGGAGLIDAVCSAVPGMRRVRLDASSNICGPLGDPLPSVDYAVREEQREIIIEMAQAAGLPLVAEAQRNPLWTTSYGVGQLIRMALQREKGHVETLSTSPRVGVSSGQWTVYLGVGGSSTNDGGLGALQALGLDIYTQQTTPGDDGAHDTLLKRPLVGRDLQFITRLEPSDPFAKLRQQFAQEGEGPHDKLVLICDVDNPFLGPRGATRTYGPQKGASSESVLQELELGMCNVANHITNISGKDISAMVGAGGAGGMSGSFACLLGAEWRCGADVVADLVNLPQLVRNADIIITGEGSFDLQTLHHKKTVAKLAELVVRVNNSDQIGTASDDAVKVRPIAVVCGRVQFDSDCDWETIRTMKISEGIDKFSSSMYDVIRWVCPLTPASFSSLEAMTNGAACIEEVVALCGSTWLAGARAK